MNFNPLATSFYKLCEKIQVGTLDVIAPDGERQAFGSGEPRAVLELHSWKTITALFSRGDIGLGETYSDGLWDSPDLEALFLLALKNSKQTHGLARGSMFQRLAFMFKDRVMRRNSRQGSRKNIQAHYDVGNDFYQLWLDDSMTYSSALFASDDESLEVAQRRKYDRLLNAIKPAGDRVLEIGCGWGGFAERAADEGCNLTGVTISPAQHEFAHKRLSDRANINLTDYRDIKGKFDAIVSIEMIEAVGIKYWPEYFKTLKARLNDGGKIALQAIVVEDEYFDQYKTQSDYIRQYTFPGGMLISPGHIQANAANAGLKTENIFRFGLDYAKTLREWLNRFNLAEPKIRALGYDDAFLRSWRFYLQICAATFQNNRRTNVIHVELSHS